MFVSDSREPRRRPYPDIQPIAQLMSHFSPLVLKYRANAKGSPFEEIAHPARLRNFPADLSSMGAFLKPNHMMANFESR